MRRWRHPGINLLAALLVLAGVVAESWHRPHCLGVGPSCHHECTPVAAGAADQHACDGHAHGDTAAAPKSDADSFELASNSLALSGTSCGDDASDCVICRFLAQSSHWTGTTELLATLLPAGREEVVDLPTPTLRRTAQNRSRAPPAVS